MILFYALKNLKKKKEKENNVMLNKIKTYIAHLLVLLSPSNYVDIINNAFSPEELDEELRRRTFNDRS